MRKIILGSVASICMSVGFSSLRNAKTVGAYYFSINAGVDVLAGQPTRPSLRNSEIAYITSHTGCGVGSGFLNVVTFATSLLTVGHQHLIGPSAKQIKSTVCTRASN